MKKYDIDNVNIIGVGAFICLLVFFSLCPSFNLWAKEYDSTDFELTMGKAKQSIYMNKKNDAIKHLREAEKIAQQLKSANAMQEVAQVYEQLGDKTRAEECMKNAQSYSSTSGKSSSSSSGKSGSSGGTSSTVQVDERIYNEYMSNIGNARQHINMNKKTDAIKYLKIAEKKAEEMKVGKFMLEVAQVYEQLGDKTRSEECKAKADSYMPSSSKTKTSASSSSSDSATFDLALGKAKQYLHMNKKNDAIKYLKEAESIAENNKNASSMKDVAQVYYEMGEKVKYQECMDKAQSYSTSSGKSTASSSKTPSTTSPQTDTSSVNNAFRIAINEVKYLMGAGKEVDALQRLKEAEKIAEETKNQDSMWEVALYYQKFDKNSKYEECSQKAMSYPASTNTIQAKDAFESILKQAYYYIQSTDFTSATKYLKLAEQLAEENKDKKGMLKVAYGYKCIGKTLDEKRCKEKADTYPDNSK